MLTQKSSPTDSAEETLRLWFSDRGRRFIEDYYMPLQLLVEHGPVERFGFDLQAFADVERFILSAPPQPPLTVYLNNQATGPRQTLADPRRAVNYYRAGSTISIESGVVPRSYEIGSALARALGQHVAEPATILSPVGEAVPAHFDGGDVFVLMIKGRKQWTIAPNQTPFTNYSYFPAFGGAGNRGGVEHFELDTSNPATLFYRVDNPPTRMPVEGSQTVVLEPGSVVFLPNGWWHKTECLEPSISYSYRVGRKVLGDVLVRAIAEKLSRDDRWRAPLPMLMSKKYRAEAIKSLEDALVSFAEDVRLHGTRDIVSSELGAYFLRNNDRVLEVDNTAGQAGGLARVKDRQSQEQVEVRAPAQFPPSEFLSVLQWINAQNGLFVTDLSLQFPRLTPEKLNAALEAANKAGLIVKAAAPAFATGRQE
jgi:50S ribosomal protein L16 3-hydroxylase